MRLFQLLYFFQLMHLQFELPNSLFAEIEQEKNIAGYYILEDNLEDKAEKMFQVNI